MNNTEASAINKAINEVGNWKPCSKDLLGNDVPWASIHKCFEVAKEFTGLKIIHSMLREESEKQIATLERELSTAAKLSIELQQKLDESLKREKEKDPRMLREQIRVCDAAYNHIQQKLAEVEKEVVTLRECNSQLVTTEQSIRNEVNRLREVYNAATALMMLTNYAGTWTSESAPLERRLQIAIFVVDGKIQKAI